MTEITFHFNVAEPMAYVCRLLRKAMRMGALPVVTGPTEVLDRLDRQLWAFEPASFVPHVRLRAGTALTPPIQATPVWLVDDTGLSDRHEVLVNLGERPPAGFESYARLVEIVSTAPGDRAAARLRWKHYQDRGYKIVEHAVSA
jgi:DNA polymerase-3 subunit chi